MSSPLSTVRLVNAVRRRTQLVRGRLWALHPCLLVAPGVQIGRGLRLRVEPGSRVVLGPGCEVDDGVTLAASRGARLALGPRVFVGHHATLAARESLTVGAGTFLAELVSVRDHDHDPDAPPASGQNRVAPVAIGDDCWLASKVTVTRGVRIGDRVVVGANAVVNRSLPDDSRAVGVPARALGASSEGPRAPST